MGASNLINPDSFAALVLCFTVLLIGATTQRVAGMGVGLVAGPVLAIIFGPADGILLVNVLSCISLVTHLNRATFWFFGFFLCVCAGGGLLVSVFDTLMGWVG